MSAQTVTDRLTIPRLDVRLSGGLATPSSVVLLVHQKICHVSRDSETGSSSVLSSMRWLFIPLRLIHDFVMRAQRSPREAPVPQRTSVESRSLGTRLIAFCRCDTLHRCAGCEGPCCRIRVERSISFCHADSKRATYTESVTAQESRVLSDIMRGSVSRTQDRPPPETARNATSNGKLLCRLYVPDVLWCSQRRDELCFVEKRWTSSPNFVARG